MRVFFSYLLGQTKPRKGGALALNPLGFFALFFLFTILTGCSCQEWSKSPRLEDDQVRESLGEKPQYRGFLVVLSAPSGVGKTSLAQALHEADPHIEMSVSVTTRPKRPKEIEGVHYHFVDETTFERMGSEGAFIETALLYGHQYGTLQGPLKQALDSEKDVVLVLDAQGARQIKEHFKEEVIKVFLVPPSEEALAHRLRARAQDSEESIRTRLAHAAQEMSYWGEYDYVIIAHEMKRSLKTLLDILAVERLRPHRQRALKPFMDHVIKECQERSEGKDKGTEHDK